MNRKQVQDLGNTGKSWTFPLCAPSRLPSVPGSTLPGLSEQKKKNLQENKSSATMIYRNKIPIIPGRLQCQYIEDLNVNPKDLPPLHFLRNCFSGTLVNKKSPLTMLRHIQLCREFIFCLIDNNLIRFSEELSALLVMSKEKLKLLQFDLPSGSSAEIDLNQSLSRSTLLETINSWLREYAFPSQRRKELSSLLIKKHSVFDSDLKHVDYNLLVAYDDQRKVEMNFFQAMKSLEGGKYMHSIVYLDCRAWNSFSNSSSNPKYFKSLEQQIYEKFLARALHSDSRYNDLTYVDFKGCDLSDVDPYRLIAVLQDIKCQKHFKDEQDEDKIAKVQKISIAFLSLESVIFQSKTLRIEFLYALLPLFCDKNFYFLDLFGWDSKFIKQCFRAHPEWLTIKRKCCF